MDDKELYCLMCLIERQLNAHDIQGALTLVGETKQILEPTLRRVKMPPAYRAWIMERIKSGELAETLKKRGMELKVESQALEVADAPAGRLTAAVAHVERGDGVGEVDAAIDGESFRVSLQVPFLLAILDRLNSPQVAIEFLQSNSHIAPVVMRPVGDDTFVHVVMPLADDASPRIDRNGDAPSQQRDDVPGDASPRETQPQDSQEQANPEDEPTLVE